MQEDSVKEKKNQVTSYNDLKFFEGSEAAFSHRPTIVRPIVHPTEGKSGFRLISQAVITCKSMLTDLYRRHRPIFGSLAFNPYFFKREWK